MQCSACRHENRPQALFCEQCGARLERLCPACGDAVQPGARFCGHCGGALESAPQAAAGPSPLGARAEAFAKQIPSYTPRHLVEKVLTTRGAMEGERRQVTVLFADVCGFTGISENLDPEEVHRLMDRCFEILAHHIHRFEGTINQFTGDGVMALFGAPVAHEDSPHRAIRAALAIQSSMRAYGERVQREQGLNLQMRMGVNTGNVVVGKIGDDLRMDYTAVGDTTNLAFRLQSVTEPGTVLVSEHTHRFTKDYFEFAPVVPIEVKGKSHPVAVYHALRPKAVQSRLEVAARRGLTPLVARQAELDHLMAAFAKAKEGHGQVVSLVGEAGVGKSRLAYEFKERLRGEDITLWEAYCPPYGQATPFLPLAQIVKKYCGIEEGDDEAKIRQKVGAT
ncbi:MAG: adenylate/guanylate cyclase domain-containing protein [Nitrospinota bacterium]